jgi:small ligand-binding sensory domain FIST
MKALGITAIKGPKSEFAVTIVESWDSRNQLRAAAELSGNLHQLNPDTRMILLFPPSEGMLAADKIIEGVESVFGPEVPLIGGIAMDNMKAISCFQFYNDRIIEKGALMIGISDPTLKLFSQASHGMRVMKEMSYKATKAESNIIFELNGQPAWKLIAKTLDIPESTPWAEYGMLAFLANEVPAPLQDALGEPFYLNVLIGDPETGVLSCNRTVRQGSDFYLAKRDEELMFQGVDHIAHRIAGHLEGKQPVAVFHADCIIRGRMSFDRVLKDEIVARMQYPVCQGQKIPWLGFYSGGEFSYIGGKNIFNIFTSTLNVLYRD